MNMAKAKIGVGEPKGQEIAFEVAVEQAKLISQNTEENYLALGQIGANVVHPTYGDKVLNKLAAAAGINYSSLRGYVATWKAYADVKFAGRPAYSVLAALVNHPDHVKLISDKPNMKVSEARKAGAGI